jgi:uncharacterized membrane protein
LWKHLTTGNPDSTPQASSSGREGSIDFHLADSLRSLRGAFFWIFIGLVLSLIPIADMAGVIILLVGIILLIIALGKMGKTKLSSASMIRSARNWILAYLLISIVVFVATMVVVISALISFTTSVTVPGSNVVPSPLSVLFTGTVMIVFITSEVVGLIVGLISYIRLSQSLKILGRELSVIRIANAGRYLIYSIIITVIGSLSSTVVIFSYSTLISVQRTSSISSVVALLPLIALPLIVILVGAILEIVAFHSAYSGIDDFFQKKART